MTTNNEPTIRKIFPACCDSAETVDTLDDGTRLAARVWLPTIPCHNLYQLFWNMFLPGRRDGTRLGMILCTAGSAVMAMPVYE
ncbi:MAG: hypothetical protein CM1200mP39_27920 [Dehalococcoidia bacterium]|nr:MAG: hypothetical protein CM1200mP39_27920 [Dehalococcoidia bacterium]